MATKIARLLFVRISEELGTLEEDRRGYQTQRRITAACMALTSDMLKRYSYSKTKETPQIYIWNCDGQRNCPKHVRLYSKNKFEKLVHLFRFIIRNITMHGPLNVKCWWDFSSIGWLAERRVPSDIVSMSNLPYLIVTYFHIVPSKWDTCTLSYWNIIRLRKTSFNICKLQVNYSDNKFWYNIPQYRCYFVLPCDNDNWKYIS
jgi:hypothetical protein